MTNVSPPTASVFLKNMEAEGLLVMRNDRNAIVFRANRQKWLFQKLAEIYWKAKLIKILAPVHKALLYPTITIFGSIAKVENTISSDLDLYVNSPKNEMALELIEKKLGRKVHLLFSSSESFRNLSKAIKSGIQIF